MDLDAVRCTRGVPALDALRLPEVFLERDRHHAELKIRWDRAVEEAIFRDFAGVVLTRRPPRPLYRDHFDRAVLELELHTPADVAAQVARLYVAGSGHQ